jgi:hypothetical protein
MKRFFVCIFLAFFLVACGDEKTLDTQPTPTTSPDSSSTTSNSKNAIQGDFTEKKVFELLFNNYNETQKESNWVPTKEDLSKADEESPLREAKEFYVKNLLISPFQESGVEKQLLVTAAAPPEHDCHACAPIIGMFVFKKNGDSWELEQEQKYVTELGSYGVAPDAKLVEIGKGNYGALFEYGDTGQGYTSEAVILIARVEKVFKEILNVETAGDNSGACGEDIGPCWKFSSTYEFTQGKNGNFFDFKISLTGTKAGDETDQIVSADEEKTYVFDGKEYEESN